MGREGRRASSRNKSPKRGAPVEEEKPASTLPRSTATDDDAKEESQSTTTSEPQNHPLARVTEGMNQRSLITGMYGSRGERIRHVVANGALSMPEEALDIMESFEDGATIKKEDKSTASQPKNKKRKACPLPELDSVTRPSLDRSLGKIIVTDVFHKQFVHPTDPTQPPTCRTVAANRPVDLTLVTAEVPDAERIRGGGGDGAADEAMPDAGAAAAGGDPPSGQEADSAKKDPPADSAATPSGPPAPVPQPATEGANTQQTVAPSTTQQQAVTAPVPAPHAASQPAALTSPARPDKFAAQAARRAEQEAANAASAAAPTTATTPAPVASTPAPTAGSATAAQQPGSTVTSAPAPAPASASAPVPATPTKTTSATPTPVPSSATKPAEAATDKVIPLANKPEPHWEQHIPGQNDENLTDPEAKTAKPGWYDPKTVSNLERTLLPEWFDGSASHRTVETYLKARETMIHISQKLENRFVTSTLARRSLPGDVGSLHRLHNFLTCYLWMNEEGRNDSAPTASSLQQPPQLFGKVWTEKRRGDLLEAVVEASQQQQAKKQKADSEDPMEIDHLGAEENAFVAIDWNAIGEKVGASAGECEREFLAMPLDDASVATTTEQPSVASEQPRASSKLSSKDEMAQEEFVRSLVEETSPNVIRAVTEAALTATGQNLPAAQRAARLGLVANQAAQAAQAHEETVSRLLSEVIDQRMQKLECRMALMDDLEGMLEAERVALELERRDLYTTKCRDWFGAN